jgi:hypothetical protein
MGGNGELDTPGGAGKKELLHVGSAQAGPTVAAILSAVESCRRLGVPVKDYFTAVLPGLNDRTLSEVANLTPARWSTVPPQTVTLVPCHRQTGYHDIRVVREAQTIRPVS